MEVWKYNKLQNETKLIILYLIYVPLFEIVMYIVVHLILML